MPFVDKFYKDYLCNRWREKALLEVSQRVVIYLDIIYPKKN